MKKYKKLRNIRPKAVLGESLAAAGISAAATLTAAGINAAAQNKAAKQQADAVQRQAEMQARSMQEINDNNTALQEKQINFQASENERNRKIQQDIQMTLQMQQGALNEADRLNSAKIQLKKGGRIRPHNAFLWGSNSNLPFKVIDGGGVQHIGITPEGYDLYEIYGNDHNHYHKAQGGKNKTGVGIKFAGGKVVEGEGNQNSNQGELMLVTPNDAKFISKHSIKGFNPAKAVLNGMNPNDAFVYQELIKGKVDSSSPLRKKQALGGGYHPYLGPWAISNATTNNQLFPGLSTWAISNNNMNNINNIKNLNKGKKVYYCSELNTAPSRPATSSAAVFEIGVLKGETFSVYREDIDKWQSLYPSVNIEQQIRNMIGWLEGHPKRRKTLEGMPRFIHNWLSGEQNKGGQACVRNNAREGLDFSFLSEMEDGE